LDFFQFDTNALHPAFFFAVIAPPLLHHSLPLELPFFLFFSFFVLTAV
jgi:hypothetical protein